MNLRQDVLRSQTDALEKKLASVTIEGFVPLNANDYEDEWINVASAPGTPVRSHPSSRSSSRPQSPTSGTALRPIPRPLTRQTKDPLRVLPTDLSLKVFSLLSVSDLARCSRVSRKWYNSQTLNYVWFNRYRKENFPHDSLPAGKWSRRESKQNWRTIYAQLAISSSSPPTTAQLNEDRASGRSSPASSGYHTPKELREEKWRQEAEAVSKPGKVEMRSIYKELGGRKSKAKTKVGSSGVRDKGGWLGPEFDE